VHNASSQAWLRSGAAQTADHIDALLQVKNLRLNFHTYAGEVKALDGVTFSVKKGEALGLVGESGCGKSVTALTIVGLLPENASVVDGEILLGSEDLLKIRPKEMREVRANRIAMVFQDPTTFLNPVLTIGEQIEEVIRYIGGFQKVVWVVVALCALFYLARMAMVRLSDSGAKT
jgi:ABC-type dipeptide/oligopeptide/nickel transport system ATPase component